MCVCVCVCVCVRVCVYVCVCVLFMYICTRIGIMFTIYSRFSDFWEQDDTFLSPDLFGFVTLPFCFCHLSSILHISNI